MCNYRGKEFIYDEKRVSFHNCLEPALDGDPHGLCIFHSELAWDQKPDFDDRLDEYNSRQPMIIEFMDEENNSTLTKKAVYNYIGCIFPDHIDFSEKIFCEDVIFNEAVFGEWAFLSHCTFEGKALFENASFGDNCSFEGSVFKAIARFDRSMFGNLTIFSESRFHEHTNFTGVIFGDNAFFNNAKFKEKSFFIAAVFGKNADFGNTIFDDFVSFTLSKFGEDAYFSGATIHGTTNYAQTKFVRANLSGLDLQRADLRGSVLENTRVSGVSYPKGTLTAMKNMPCRGINASTCFGSPRFKKFVQHQDFIEELRESKSGQIIFTIWWLFSDCGRSLMKWFIWLAGFVLIFACQYYAMGIEHFKIAELSHECLNFETYLYYSVVTATTLGFGDVIPKSIEAARWVMAEVVIGYIMLGGLISIFTTKFVERS